MKKLVHFIALIFCSLASAQDGGRNSFAFLEIPASARIAALGGTFIAVKDHDLNAALQAPSLLNPSMDKQLAFGMVTYFDRTRLGDASYAIDRGKWGTFMTSMHYADYGTFKMTNEYGDVEGSFKAADYCLTTAWGYRYNPRFSMGAGVKFLYSDYYIYNSFAAALDFSATYEDTANNFTATLLARNIGAQIDTYVPGQQEPLPAEILVGCSKRLAHTPLRFSLTYRHLEKFDLSYQDPYNLTDIDPLTGQSSVKKVTFAQKFTKHFILGTEILLTRNFHLRAAYNFQRRQELVTDTKPGTVGFSFGFGLKVSKFVLGYARANYHLSAAANHFSIAMNLGEFAKRK
ncbi:MAG: type IX secretion system protein PorQ [Bacteroidota bacterium]